MKSRIFLDVTIALVLVVNQSLASTSKICDSQKCVQQAARITDYVDPDANPCEDFYQFACGNFLKNAHGNESLSLENRLFSQIKDELTEIYQEDIHEDDHKMVKAAKRLYQSCMDQSRLAQDGVKPIKKILQTLGGWPVVEGSNWAEESFDWLNTTYQLRRLGYFFQAFLDLSVDSDQAKTLRLQSSGRFYVPEINVMVKMAVLFGAENDENTLKELTDVKEFSEVLSKLEQTTDYFYNTIEKLQEKEGVIDWLEFINNIVGSKAQFSKHDRVLSPTDGYLKQLINLVSETPKRVQANYMVVKMIQQIHPFLPCEYQSSGCSLNKESRAEFCLILIYMRFIPDPIEIIRHRKHLSKERREKIEEFVLRLKSKFLDAVNKVESVSKEAKQTITGKIRELKVIVGWPGNYFDDAMLDIVDVDMIDVEDNAPFFSLLAQATRNLHTSIYTQSLELPPFQNIYIYIIHYSSDRNVLYVPSTATGDFLFDENRPEYLNYGTFGTMILFPLSEIFVPYIQDHTNAQNDDFSSKMECWRLGPKSTAYDNYKSWQMLDTLKMGIAENISYTAYEEWIKNNGEQPKLASTDYTPNQLFWISTAIPRCLPLKDFHFRRANWFFRTELHPYSVTGSMGYNPNFSKDFNCPVNSTMNPSKKCEIL